MFFEMRFDLGTLDSGERSLLWATCNLGIDSTKYFLLPEYVMQLLKINL